MKTALIISLAFFLLPLGYLAKDAGSEFLAVDSCLDSGGSYDYNKNECDKMTNHPYISYYKRNKASMVAGLLLSLGGLISSVLIKRKTKKHD